ncbi:hypothetical protein PLICRDRAFT_33061 [Plicaturopsis crispa FD-325 SS-3]|uniref:Uncharacterized protein n=1 Tax=Plicaturopsis crispa FD-325 SS-3 TaxID=944288 RepID=A0A0C9SPY5_PLICR|nr:hypothetical protein PLICRDRAFT_33061 [Plicaturopsis crispa FD-325 SS-3]
MSIRSIDEHELGQVRTHKGQSRAADPAQLLSPKPIVVRVGLIFGENLKKLRTALPVPGKSLKEQVYVWVETLPRSARRSSPFGFLRLYVELRERVMISGGLAFCPSEEFDLLRCPGSPTAVPWEQVGQLVPRWCQMKDHNRARATRTQLWQLRFASCTAATPAVSRKSSHVRRRRRCHRPAALEEPVMAMPGIRLANAAC